MGVESVSQDPDASALTASGAVPEVGPTVSEAVGALPATVEVAVAVLLWPAVSVTVSVTGYVPSAVYVCEAEGLACGATTVPSPKSKLYVAIGEQSVSEDAEPSAVTSSGALPLPGD